MWRMMMCKRSPRALKTKARILLLEITRLGDRAHMQTDMRAWQYQKNRARASAWEIRIAVFRMNWHRACWKRLQAQRSYKRYQPGQPNRRNRVNRRREPLPGNVRTQPELLQWRCQRQ